MEKKPNYEKWEWIGIITLFLINFLHDWFFTDEMQGNRVDDMPFVFGGQLAFGLFAGGVIFLFAKLLKLIFRKHMDVVPKYSTITFYTSVIIIAIIMAGKVLV